MRLSSLAVKDSFKKGLICSSSLAQMNFNLKVKVSVKTFSRIPLILDCLINEIFSTNCFTSLKSVISSLALNKKKFYT